MGDDQQRHADEIAATLRNLIPVRPPMPNSLLWSTAFWRRCRRIDDGTGLNIIHVDGFAGLCFYNCWKVYSDAIEHGLSLWHGYASHWNRWSEHAWCMLGNRIIETTMTRAVYYGAELDPDERAVFADRYGVLKIRDKHWEKLQVATYIDGERTYAKYDPRVYGQTIGRERDPITGQIKEGIGR